MEQNRLKTIRKYQKKFSSTVWEQDAGSSSLPTRTKIPWNRMISWNFVVLAMDTKDILLELCTKNGLSQDQFADKVHMTQQAVSR